MFQSANPDFFIAHFDVEALLQFPIDQPAKREEQPNEFHQMCERVRTMPKATIAKIAGRVGGGGSEFAASCDMRFGAIGVTKVNQMEVGLGILPGGTGTQRLPRLVGRGRALEIILGSDDLDAVTAERWGYLNRALQPMELDTFVDNLALRIASFPPEAVAHAKRSVLNAERMPTRGRAARGVVPVPGDPALRFGAAADEAVPRARRADPDGRAARRRSDEGHRRAIEPDPAASERCGS